MRVTCLKVDLIFNYKIRLLTTGGKRERCLHNGDGALSIGEDETLAYNSRPFHPPARSRTLTRFHNRTRRSPRKSITNKGVFCVTAGTRSRVVVNGFRWRVFFFIYGTHIVRNTIVSALTGDRKSQHTSLLSAWFAAFENDTRSYDSQIYVYIHTCGIRRPGKHSISRRVPAPRRSLEWFVTRRRQLSSTFSELRKYFYGPPRETMGKTDRDREWLRRASRDISIMREFETTSYTARIIIYDNNNNSNI